MNEDQRTYLVKKLLYKSNYRGCKETDQVLGNFAKEHVSNMTDQELNDFDYLLSQMDTDIWDWINNKKPPPDHVSRPLLNKISNYFLS